MYYVYMLKRKNNDIYYGYTNNLKRRLEDHNRREKVKLVYYESYLSESDARIREMKLKQYGQARKHLKDRIFGSIKGESLPSTNCLTISAGLSSTA